MNDANALFNQITEQWGDKEVYLVTEAEFKVLSDSTESQIVKLKSPNGDGTATSELLFRNKKIVSFD